MLTMGTLPLSYILKDIWVHRDVWKVFSFLNFRLCVFLLYFTYDFHCNNNNNNNIQLYCRCECTFMNLYFLRCRWLEKLGLSAQRGIGVVMRQTLYGYNYALLDIDMNPNPVNTCTLHIPSIWLCLVLHGGAVVMASDSSLRVSTQLFCSLVTTLNQSINQSITFAMAPVTDDHWRHTSGLIKSS